MNQIPAPDAAVPPVLVAALLLVAVPLLKALGLPRPTAAAVLEATGVSSSRAYELRAAIEAVLPTLLRPPGRPPRSEPPPADLETRLAVTGAVRDYLQEHGGAFCRQGARREYTVGFRWFVLDLAARFRDLPLEALAEAVGFPLPTLKDWLAGGSGALRPAQSATTATLERRDPTQPQVETVLAVWSSWKGPFTQFCRCVQQDWRIPFGRTLIARILAAHGVRFAKRRSGRSPDEDALRGAFVTFFPNAQWVGDGSPISVTVGLDTFTFNVELLVDPASGAVTGASIDDVEDGAALISAFDDAVTTTGSPPLAVLVDNKPSNHTDEVREALGDTRIVRATVQRPQNKAHVEGAYGLFQQTVPDLELVPGPPKELARQLLSKIVATWARTLNHRPRADRNRRSRIELHLDHTPTAEEIAAAEAALDERIRRQELARETRAARTDPLVRAVLTAAFARLGFVDPDGVWLDGIARYPVDAVVEGIAIVEGKRRAGTLPAGADVRYLLGCVRNVAEEREGWEIGLSLWAERTRARDLALSAAERERVRLDEDLDDPEPRIQAYVDRALRTSRQLDRFYWLTAAVDVVLDGDRTEHEPLFRLAARRIHASHTVPHRERLAATRFLAARILPIA
jgi:hypothetical protein